MLLQRMVYSIGCTYVFSPVPLEISTGLNLVAEDQAIRVDSIGNAGAGRIGDGVPHFLLLRNQTT